MDERALHELLEAVRAGTTSADDAVAQLRRLPWADLGFAEGMDVLGCPVERGVLADLGPIVSLSIRQRVRGK